MAVFKDRVIAMVVVVVLVVGLGFWLYIHNIRIAKPPEVIIPPPKPQPPDTGWTRIMKDTIVIPGTDSYCEVAAWIPTGSDRYRAGETLVVVVGMRNPYQAPITVSVPETRALVDVRVVLEGKSYGMQRGDPSIWFGEDVDSMIRYYTDTPQPRIPGYALAWQMSPEQLSRLRRRLTIQPRNDHSPEWMGSGWIEVGRVEIPCDGVSTIDENALVNSGKYEMYRLAERSQLRCDVVILGNTMGSFYIHRARFRA